MTFEITEDVIQDMVAMFGKEQAINELIGGFRALLETTIEEIEKNPQ